MDTLQFEAVKMALKQNKDGYVLTMSIHPDEIPDDLMRDFVGSRYQVVMVRLGDDEMPLDRRDYDGDRAVKLAGVLCREKSFKSSWFKTTRSLILMRLRPPNGCGARLVFNPVLSLKPIKTPGQFLLKLTRTTFHGKEINPLLGLSPGRVCQAVEEAGKETPGVITRSGCSQDHP
jgi:hypothetical protein